MHWTWRSAALACAATLVCAGSAAAAPGYDDDTVIVKFRPGTTAAQQQAVLAGAPVVGTINGLGSQVVRVAAEPRVAAAALNRSPFVQYAEVNRILRAFATPNDPRFGELYGLNNTGQGGGKPD